MSKQRMYTGDNTCFSCQRTKNICLDCPRLNKFSRYKLSALNVMDENDMLSRPEFLPGISINSEMGS